jgi:hypothetical protein
MLILRSLRGTIALPIFVLWFLHVAPAGVGNICTTGTCVIDHPIYINLYWDSSPAQWDIDVKAASTGMGHARLDAFVKALDKSDYFDPMGKPGNYKVYAPRTLTSITSACAPIPANVDESFDKVVKLVKCVLDANPSLKNSFSSGNFVSNIIFNVFLPPQVVNTSFCTFHNGAHFTAKHEVVSAIPGTLAMFAVTMNPTDSTCNADFKHLGEGLSHEMVEAATDPNPSSPTGFKVFFIGDKGGEEIGDLCENTFTPFLFGFVTQYWSNLANGCVTGFNLKAPKISSVDICGSGGAMKMKLTGKFGAEPWDLTSDAFHDQTLYLRAAISGSNSWDAGNIEGLPPDRVGFGFIDWTQGTDTDPDTITINGFNAKYGSSGQQVMPGDTVTFSVFSQDTGQRSNSVAGTATSVKKVSFLVYGDSPVYVNSGGPVAGVVSDNSGCGIGNVPVALSATSGSLPGTTTTISGGEFSAHYAAPDVAGKVKINADSAPANRTVTVSIYPRMKSLSRQFGSVSGNQQITLKGAGFDSSTTIKFSQVYKGSAKATIDSVGPGHKTVVLTTPKTFLPGDGTGTVAVTANVNGVHSDEVLEYTYIVAGKPVIDMSSPCGSGPGKLTVTAYNDDGSVDAVSLNLSANYSAFNNGTSNTATIHSGGTINAQRGGVITATNPATSASANVLFECLKVKVPVGAPAQQFILQPEGECSGDCGGLSGNVAIWTRQIADISVADRVAISGRPSDELQQDYNVRGVGIAELERLTSGVSQVTIGQQATRDVEFLGSALEIQRTDATDATPIKENAQIAFILPAGTVGNRDYAIVRCEKSGNSLVWTGDSPTRYEGDMGVVRAQATKTGVYALVTIAAPTATAGKVN